MRKKKSDGPTGDGLEWRPIEDHTGKVPPEAIARRAGAIGERAAAELVWKDHDALWIDGAHGRNVLTPEEEKGVQELLERALENFERRNQQ